MFDDILKKNNDIIMNDIHTKLQEWYDKLSKEKKDKLYDEVDKALIHFKNVNLKEPTELEELAITGEVLRKHFEEDNYNYG